MRQLQRLGRRWKDNVEANVKALPFELEPYHTDMKQWAHISETSVSIKGKDLTFLMSDPVTYFVPVSQLVSQLVSLLISQLVINAEFYILLTVHLGVILVNNQPDALSSMYLFHFSACFEQPSAHHQENKLYQYIIYQNYIYQMMY